MLKSFQSYAKINLVLNVEGKNEKGYHLLDSVVLPISLHDTLIVSKLKNAADSYLTIDDFSQGSIEYNIASFALDKMSIKYKFDQKFRVFIHKNIPMKAGLGGGSSNTACLMKAVNQILKLNIPNEELKEMGLTLGCDIPFFVDCVPARMQGVGENLTRINVKNNYFVLLVKPYDGLSTKLVFDKLDEVEDNKKGNVKNVIKALEEGDDDLLAESIGNSLEAPARVLLPEVGKIIDSLKEDGLKIVGMSGSGSTVFAMSTNLKQLKQIAKKYENTYFVEIAKVVK